MISGLGAINQLALPGLQNDTTSPAQSGSVTGAEAGFGTMLSETLGHTVGRLEHAEKLSLQALQGDVDTREVVDAVMSAEQTLQAAISIRDKIVTAYLEVSRMTI